MNSAAGVNQKCIKARTSTGDSWKCMLSEYNALYLSTPTFLLQPIYDFLQFALTLGVWGNSAADIAKVNQLGQNVTDLVQKQLLDSNAKHGAFLDSCARHCGLWGMYKDEDGKTAAVAFEEWYKGPQKQLYTQNKKYPCQSCCQGTGS